MSVLVLGLAAALASAPMSGQRYSLVARSQTFEAALGLVRIEQVFQDGDNLLDRFTVTRLVKADAEGNPLPPGALRGAIILLPGSASNFEMFEVGHSAASIANYLATMGVDVYGYSPRARGVPPGYCDAPSHCAPMAGWGLDTYVSDIDYVRGLATQAYPSKLPLIGGASLGVFLTIASLRYSPAKYSGAILWEGTLYLGKYGFTNTYARQCQRLTADVQSGSYFDASSGALQLMLLLYLTAPDAQSPFASNETNRQFAEWMLTTSMGPPNGPPGYTYFSGDVGTGFQFLDETLLGDFAAQFNAYEPLALERDYTCAMAGDRTYTDGVALASFRGAILSLQAGRGFGRWAEANLGLFTQATITRYQKQQYGHADLIVPKDYAAILDQPIGSWVSAVLSRGP
jgi:hypothetical protein